MDSFAGQTQPDISLITSGGQPVDTEAAREFMAAILDKIAYEELRAVEAELREKGRRLQALVQPDVLPALTEDQLLCLLRTVFATRRRAGAILAEVGPGEMKAAISQLLHGSGATEDRFQKFVDAMTGFFGDIRVLRPRKSTDSRARESAEEAALKENVFCDLGSELLHFTNPDDYWLWTRWIWDPRAGTGAMPLVTMEETNLHGRTVGETYLKIGLATAFVKATGEAADFATIRSGPFGIDVFLACVYVVYMYTTLRLRMTQEFNKVVPQMPELIRRILGVWKLEI
ncbi:MAG: hypothetical protein ACE5H9_11640 [Anaerolineae bacterium]